MPFIQKLRQAVVMELDYWEERDNPPNLSISEFKMVLQQMPSNLNPIWEPRTSTSGAHGKSGEKNIFKVDFEITLFRKKQRFFMKGYFFDETELKGVTIQSFRRK